MSRPLAGLMAEFETPEKLLDAVKKARAAGFKKMDAYSPFPIEGLSQSLGQPESFIPFVVLSCGIMGGLGGYFIEWYASVKDYPVDIGGRPLHSWPSFIPITFELTVLAASLSAIVAMLAFNRLPQPHHPVFNVAGFERASTDRFFLCVESSDPKFDRAATEHFLASLEPVRVSEVPE